MLHDRGSAIATLQRLKDLGVNLAIDDFGTGYSSLSYIKQLPINTLKIDRSFVSGLGRKADDGAIVKGILAMASSLNLEVTGEGIETRQQKDQLQSLGCSRGQGYLFAKPLAAAEITARLSDGTLSSDGLTATRRETAA